MAVYPSRLLFHNVWMRLALSLFVALLCACSDDSGSDDLGERDGASEGLIFSDGGPDSGPPPDSAVDTGPDPNDRDGDGLTNEEEEQLGTDPDNADTDNDGKSDLEEVGSAAAPQDSDGDGKHDALEPDDFDSDGDGTNDVADKEDLDGPCAGLRLYMSATLDADRTLTSACSPYKILGYLRVEGGATLTLESGVVLRFGPGAALFLGAGSDSRGSLAAQGGSVFVSLIGDSADPGVGYWRGVVAEHAGSVLLAHTVISGAGGGSEPRANLSVSDISGRVTMVGCKIETGAGVGVHASAKKASGALFDSFENNSFSGLQAAAAVDIAHVHEIGDGNDLGPPGAGGEVRVLGSTLAANASWRGLGAGVPYVFQEKAIAVQATLQLQAGAILTFPPEGELAVGFGASGQLNAIGTKDASVVLRSASGTGGSWNGLLLYAGFNSLLYAEILGAGRTSTQGVDAALFVDKSVALIANGVLVKNSGGDGVYYQRASGQCSSSPPSAVPFSFSAVSGCELFCKDENNGAGVCLSNP